MFRRFVRIGDAGEFLDFTAARLCVHLDLAVARLADFNRAVRVDFDEVVADHHAQLVARLAVRGDRRTDHRDSIALEQVSHEADAADVRVAVFLREAEALRKIRANDVAVQRFEGMARRPNALLEYSRDRGFAGAREPGEPDDETGVLSSQAKIAPHKKLYVPRMRLMFASACSTPQRR